ncbi:PREDICTED: LOC18777347 [Prunus dulcis]|uniref:PREDICTED: LOC18777347 n=1 Tax=Prunus dulcis TaxID=3755 RepID=A0A5E4GFV0_PRUDU|nr:PREDICTED: LOC18777347 [Prunus dulcis]
MGMKGDFQFGSDSNSLNLLSEVSVVVKNWEEDDVEKAMAMAVRSCCCNPLHGYGFDGCLIPQKAMVKQNKGVFSSSSSSSSSLDMLAEVATQQLMESEDGNGLTTKWVFEEKAVLAEFISFCAKKERSEFKTFHFSDINIPKKKRSSMRRTQRRFLPHASHDSVQSVNCMNMKRKRLSAHSGSDHGHEDNHNEALVQKKQKLVHVQSTADVNSLQRSDDTVQQWSIRCKSQFRFALVKVSKTKAEVQQCGHGASTYSSSQNGKRGSSIYSISHDS